MKLEDRLTQFQKPPRKAFKHQLREQLAQIEQEQDFRSDHTHIKENKDMNTIALPQRRDPPLDIFARHLLTAIVAVLMAAFVFIMMINSPLIHSPGFLGIFQDVEEYQRDQVELYINQAWNTGDTAILPDLLSEDHVTTTTIFGTVQGIDGVANLIRSYRTAMPDFMYTINQISSVDDTVWLRGTITGTHTGTFTLPDGTEIPPSGNSVTIDSIIEFTFEENKISAINQVDNTQDLMEQFGAAQPVEVVAKTARNVRSTTLAVQNSYAAEPPDLSHDGEPSLAVREYYTFGSGAFDAHLPFGEDVLSFESPDWANMDPSELPETPFRNPTWDTLRDREFTILSITGSEEAVAVSFRVNAIMGIKRWSWDPPQNISIPPGNPISFEMIEIYRLNEVGSTTEAWWYMDNREYAAAHYGWPPIDE